MGTWLINIGSVWQGERGTKAGGELVGPGPGFGDADLAFAPAMDDAGGGVQQAVAQGLGLGPGERSVQAEQAQPAQQVGGDGGGQAPGAVDLDRVRGRDGRGRSAYRCGRGTVRLTMIMINIANANTKCQLIQRA
jgi:hypothetical protein